MKNLYQKIIRFFTTQTIPPQFIFDASFFSWTKEIEKQKEKEGEKRIKQLIRNEVKKQLNKKK
jgi:hypothetical protein